MAQVQPTRVVTPEAVPLDFELAGIGSRAFALLLDWLIQVAFLFAVFFAGGVLMSQFGGSDRGVTDAGTFLLLFGTMFGYPIAMETLWRGRTIGKAAFGLRVVTKEGAPVRFRHAAIRAGFGLVDFLITSGSAAFLSAFLSRDNQRLGDIVAGTLVLRERHGMRAPQAVTFTAPAGLEPYVAMLDVAGLTADDYAGVRSFLLRAPTLPPHVREAIALELARPLTQRLRTAPPAGVSPETFLWCVAAAQQRRGVAPGTAPTASTASPGAMPWMPAPPPVVPTVGQTPATPSTPSADGGFVPPP